jgi:tRNA threonylcarbamoyladenosine biosynthesis protein TsaB
MSLLLNIDTSLETAFVTIAEQGKVLECLINESQKEHAGFLHKAIETLGARLPGGLSDLSAIAVTMGPGSYTGLRVGMATAKGLCYALNKPFITIGTLALMAKAASGLVTGNEKAVICPLIDARRMEVFMAMYGNSQEEILAPCAMILDSHSFGEMLDKSHIYFFGNGADKCKGIILHKNARFIDLPPLPATMSQMSHDLFLAGSFSHLAHTEPLYVKEFHSS